MNEKKPKKASGYVNLCFYLVISLMTFCVYLSRWITVPHVVLLILKSLGIIGYPMAIVFYVIMGLFLKASQEEAYRRQERILQYPLKILFLVTGLLLTSEYISFWRDLPQEIVSIQNAVSLYVYPLAGVVVGLFGIQTHRMQTVKTSGDHDAYEECQRPIEQNAIPIDDYPLAGFWKHKASHQFGLAIGPVENGVYFVSFCGPGGCADVTDHCTTSIYDDTRYRVYDLNTLGVKGLFGYARYQRYESRCSHRLKRFIPTQHDKKESEGV
jgi:hypothetical protein